MVHSSVRYLERVTNCIAATTRYPREVLSSNSDLEIDLGIDSVKRLEITLAIGKEFGISVDKQTREPWVRTIQDVANWVEKLEKEATPPPSQVASTSRLRVDAAVPHPVPSISAREKTSPAAYVNEFQNKVVLVTGSGRGVGSVIARLLAKSGLTVIVNSFHSREEGERTTHEILASGGSASHIWGSVANPKHLDAMFDQIESEFGKLDYLVCNASDGKIGDFSELTFDDWDVAFRTNVSGHYRCAMNASRLMSLSGGGRIITLSSVGSDGYIRGLGCQGVVKAAVETLTRYLACELGPMGIRVNCVVGGPVYGDLLSKFPNSADAQNHWESITPDGELCNPIDLANTIQFLLSDAARGVNGAVWHVDHGFSAVSDGRSNRQMVPNAWVASR